MATARRRNEAVNGERNLELFKKKWRNILHARIRLLLRGPRKAFYGQLDKMRVKANIRFIPRGGLLSL